MPNKWHVLRHKKQGHFNKYKVWVPKMELFRTFNELVNFLLVNDGTKWKYEYELGG